MSKKAFDKIAEGLNEALSIARGEAMPAKLHVPAEIDVRAICDGRPRFEAAKSPSWGRGR